MSQFDIRVTRDDSFERTVAALREAGQGHLRRELEADIRQAAKPLLPALRTAVRSVDIRAQRSAKRRRPSGSQRRLRRKIANALRIATRNTRLVGVRIEVAMGRFDPEERGLPAYTDARGKWRHPVFGNTNRGVQQYGQAWFMPTVLRHMPDFRRAVNQAMADVVRRIKGA